MTAADLIIKKLEAAGIEYIFGLPGEENLDFLESIRQSKIKLIVTRHEQTAAFMAATYGRLTGKPGVCLSTLGPGALNLVNGVAYAQLGGMPLVAITGQKAMHNNWQGKFQIVDVVGVMRPITKLATNIPNANVAGELTSEALTTAANERPGAVHLEIAEDIAGEEVTGEVANNRVETTYTMPAPDVIAAAATEIKNAKHPIIIVSAGGQRNGLYKIITNFAEKTGIYVIGTQLGKGVVSDDNPLSLFSFGMHRKDYINAAVEASDLIITIGYNTYEYPPSLWNKQKNKKFLRIDYTPAEKDEYYQPIECIGDVAQILPALLKDLKGTTFDLQDCAELRTKLEEIHKRKSDDASFPLIPQRFVADIRTVMDKEDIVTLDNGIYKLWFARHYRTFAPNTLLLDNTLATMGAGLPSAMAAKLLNPDKKVLAVCGDGGFMMNSQELITCVKENIPVVTLILNDNAYGFIEWKQRGQNLPDFGMKLENPDFVKYAESYGALGLRVTSAADLIPKLKTAFASGKPCLIDCPIDYTQNYEVFTKELSVLR